MTTIKSNFFKGYNMLIAGLLSILGFSTSCNILPLAEYGSPSAKYIINGKVTSVETGKAIKGVRVSMQGDSTLTNADGSYQVVEKYGFPGDQLLQITFKDIDGAANGEYANIDTVVEIKDPQYTGGDGDWYSGEATEEFSIKLNPKK